jgi:hypothetical protein
MAGLFFLISYHVSSMPGGRSLRPAMEAWKTFTELLKSAYPLFSPEWSYYNDGKSWLFKVHKKAKTVCWVSVWEKYFKVTFYFNDKAQELIKNSSLPKIYKAGYLRPEKRGKPGP